MNASADPDRSSHPDSHDSATGSVQPDTPKRTGGRLWAFVLIGLSFAAFYQLRDIPKWVTVQRHRAAAEDARQANDWEIAIAELNKAIDRDPSPLIYADRSRIRHEKAVLERRSEDSKEYAKFHATAELALADINQSIELGATPESYVQRALIHETLDRFRESAEDWTHFLHSYNAPHSSDQVDLGTATGLNGRAYMRALGEFEIEEAIQDIEKALSILSKDFGDRFTYEDTHAYLLLLKGESSEAVEKFEDCVAAAKQAHKKLRTINAQDGLAVIVHHRGLAYQATGKQAAAEADFKRA
ncbi:hypothetical protein ACFL2H_13945, partial [Planctomycetota bacterium]